MEANLVLLPLAAVLALTLLALAIWGDVNPRAGRLADRLMALYWRDEHPPWLRAIDGLLHADYLLWMILVPLAIALWMLYHFGS